MTPKEPPMSTDAAVAAPDAPVDAAPTDDAPATEPVVEDPPADVEPPDVTPPADDTPAADPEPAADAPPDVEPPDVEPPVVDAPDLEVAEPDTTDAAITAAAELTGLTPAQVKALAVLRAATQEWEKGYKPTVWCRACTDAKKKDGRLDCDRHNVVDDCPRCHNRITSAHVDLTYMGHAAVTNRLLMADPAWSWEPDTREGDVGALNAAIATGNPDIVRMVIDDVIPTLPPRIVGDGLWITLTVAGMTRRGFGDAQGKSGPNAVKEVIGDAIRNAAMRFGCGLDLWHKGEFQDDAVVTHIAAPSAADAADRRNADAAHAAAESPQAASGSAGTGNTRSGQQRASQGGGPGATATDPQVILDTLAGVRSRVAWKALREAAEKAPGGLGIDVQYKDAAMTMAEAFDHRAKELAAAGVS